MSLNTIIIVHFIAWLSIAIPFAIMLIKDRNKTHWSLKDARPKHPDLLPARKPLPNPRTNDN